MPFIGMTMGFTEQETRMALNMEYAQAVADAGGTPLALPPIEDEAALREVVRAMDGLVITGGVDVDPALYGHAPHPKLGELCPARDRYEVIVLREALALNKPMLCICRGLQLLNAVLGGTLHQDIETCLPNPLKHARHDRPAEAVHDAFIVPGTLLERVVGAAPLPVNSRHHQSADRLGDGLTLAALAADGVTEAAYMSGKPFVLCVQWHPESLQSKDGRHRLLFKALVEAASAR